MSRPSWNSYFMDFARLSSTRSNCIRKSVGAVIVKDNKIISTGYNGTPHNIKNCFDNGCLRCSNNNVESGKDLDLCICLHAEENAILHSYQNLNNSELYCTHKPCIGCLKRIIQVGIKKVYYNIDYKNNHSNDYLIIYYNLLNQSKLKLILVN